MEMHRVMEVDVHLGEGRPGRQAVSEFPPWLSAACLALWGGCACSPQQGRGSGGLCPLPPSPQDLCFLDCPGEVVPPAALGEGPSLCFLSPRHTVGAQ